MSSLTVANLVDRAAAKFGDKPFIFFDQPMQYENLGPGPDATSASFTEALEFTNTIAAVMRDELGVRPGDRIAVALTNVPELGLVFTAAARIGAIMVPFNYMLKAEELTRSISDCGAKVLITEPELFWMNIRDKSNIEGIEHWVMIGPREAVPDGFLSIDDLTEGYRDARVAPTSATSIWGVVRPASIDSPSQPRKTMSADSSRTAAIVCGPTRAW